jgi:hypothetical protein
MNKLSLEHKYTFEDRIHKQKLPKGFSYVLQTTDITKVLSTDGLALYYSFLAENPQKVEKSVVKKFSFTKVELLSYSKYAQRRGKPGGWDDYDRYMVIYSVPARIRGRFRSVLSEKILPFLNALEKRPKFHVSVYYRAFDKNNYKPLDRGGLYIEEDRYNENAKVLYRDEKFDLDEKLKELVS